LDTIVGEDGVYLAPLRQGCFRKSEEVLWFAFSGQLHEGKFGSAVNGNI